MKTNFFVFIFSLSVHLSIQLATQFSIHTAHAQSPAPGQVAEAASPELVVHLLDYLANDYGRAVENGEVISQMEYDEQIEFAEIVRKNAAGVSSLKTDPEFSNGLVRLRQIIDGKGPADEVASLARRLQQEAIGLAKIAVAPRGFPDLATGERTYKMICASCHGDVGRGDGPAGKGLDPAPANFHDAELVWNSAPFKFYNTIRFGVPGTGMAAYPTLSDDEVWSLAFYLKSLPHAGGPESGATGERLSLALNEAATLTDTQIAERLGGRNSETEAAVARLRVDPVGALGGPRKADPIAKAEALVLESLNAAKAGDFGQASTLAVRAYLEGVEPVEPKLRANIPGSVEDIEVLMTKFRSSLGDHAPVAQLEQQADLIAQKLANYKAHFAENKMSAGVAFGATFSIFLREGFEAVLLIVILISILKAMGQPQAIRWVHVGWMAAVVVGIGAWFASGALVSMSGMSREAMEGGISLVAVAVLIYVGFWLHRYSEMKKWRSFLETKLQAGLTTGSYAALTLVAFMAVFREAFEVVLFLRAIWVDLDSSGQSIAGMGALSSAVVLIVLSFIAVRGSRKLPLTALFKVCSWTMVALAIVLAGKGVHALQEAGLIGVSSLDIPLHLDLLGLYPSVQPLTMQVVIVAVFGFLFWTERREKIVPAMQQ